MTTIKNSDFHGLDQEMISLGMIPASQMINGNPLQKHVGVCDLGSFEQWLNMRHQELLRMKCKVLIDGREGSELFEWVMAHHAAFSEVLVNFNGIRKGPR